MGFKYRKRITLFPGFTINLSKSGMSATVGTKGCSVNMGQKGTYLNTGIPGTGIYDRIKIDKSNSKQQTHKNENDSYHIQVPMTDVQVEIKSFQPEIITSDGLFGLKEAIANAKQAKKQLKTDAKNAIKLRKKHFFLFITRFLLFGFIFKKFKNSYETYREYGEELKIIYKNFKLDVDFAMDESMLNDYNVLKNSFECLMQCKIIWDITSTQATDKIKERSNVIAKITRIPIRFSLGSLDYIKSKYEALIMQNANGDDLYIYPGLLLCQAKIIMILQL